MPVSVARFGTADARLSASAVRVEARHESQAGFVWNKRVSLIVGARPTKAARHVVRVANSGDSAAQRGTDMGGDAAPVRLIADHYPEADIAG
jgi:hypothetical protein